MPAQQRLGPHHERLPRATRQHAAQPGEQQPVARRVQRPSNLPPQDRQLVPQHKDLELLRALAAPEQNHQLEQPTHTSTYTNDLAKKTSKGPAVDATATSTASAPALSPIGFMHPTRGQLR